MNAELSVIWEREIIPRLNVVDLFRLTRVSNYFYELCNRESIWKLLCRNTYFYVPDDKPPPCQPLICVDYIVEKRGYRKNIIDITSITFYVIVILLIGVMRESSRKGTAKG
jgi:hypothetical protein